MIGATTRKRDDVVDSIARARRPALAGRRAWIRAREVGAGLGRAWLLRVGVRRKRAQKSQRKNSQ